MKYVLIAVIVVAIGCKTPEEKAANSLSSQNLQAAKISLDSIHLLTRKASIGEISMEKLSKQVEQLQGQIKNYSTAFTKSDAAQFLEYDHNKQEETIKWMEKH